MKKQYLYLIVVIVILVIAALGWYFFSSQAAYSTTNFDFRLSATPASGTVKQGQSTTSTISVLLLRGASPEIDLTISGCPTSTTCSLNPTTGFPNYYSTLTIQTTIDTPTTPGTPLGSHTINIRGIGFNSRTINYTLAVNPVKNPDSCSDSDGGRVYNIKGTVSGYGNNIPYSYTDYCLDSRTLTEYYCIGTTFSNMIPTCPNATVCSNGACA